MSLYISDATYNHWHIHKILFPNTQKPPSHNLTKKSADMCHTFQRHLLTHPVANVIKIKPKYIYIYIYMSSHIYIYTKKRRREYANFGGQHTSLEKIRKTANHNLQTRLTTKRIHLFPTQVGKSCRRFRGIKNALCVYREITAFGMWDEIPLSEVKVGGGGGLKNVNPHKSGKPSLPPNGGIPWKSMATIAQIHNLYLNIFVLSSL